MMAYRGEVGGCEGEWDGSGQRWSRSMLKSVGGSGNSILSSGFLWGAIERDPWFLGAEKKKDWLGSLRHHSSRGPGAGPQSPGPVPLYPKLQECRKALISN